MPKTKTQQKPSLLEKLLYKILNSRYLSPLATFDHYSRLALFAERMALATSFKILGDKHPHNHSTFSFLRQCKIRPIQIVDLGCSNGDKTVLLSELYPEAFCFGIDSDEEKIRCALDLGRESDKVKFISSNLVDVIQTLNIHTNSSLLFLSHVLEHIPSPIDFLLSFKQYFKYVYIEVPDFENTHLGNLRQDLGLNTLMRDPDHCYEWSRDELLAICIDAGLIVTDTEFRNGVIRIIASTS